MSGQSAVRHAWCQATLAYNLASTAWPASWAVATSSRAMRLCSRANQEWRKASHTSRHSFHTLVNPSHASDHTSLLSSLDNFLCSRSC